jgi:hypothetical protein
MTKFYYKDQNALFETCAKANGWWPSAIRLQLDTMSHETMAGHWKHDDSGEPFYLDGGKTLSVEEYVGLVESKSPHVVLGYGSAPGEKSVDSLTEAAFGAAPTLKAKAELLAAIGERAYEELRRAWGADHGLKPGAKPGTGPQAKASGEGSTNNPWSAKFGGTIAQRDSRIAEILRSKGGGTRIAAELAKAAGTTIGRPLGGK